MKHNKSLLIIGKVWPEPNSSAAGTRMMQLIDLFQKLGYHITFASAAKESFFQFDLKQLNSEKKAAVLIFPGILYNFFGDP